MSFRTTYTDTARQDMREIAEYLAQFYASTARKFSAKLEKKVASLEDMPYSCPAYEDDPYFRRMIVGDYLLFYSVDEKRQLVVIHRIIHAKRDINRQMLV